MPVAALVGAVVLSALLVSTAIIVGSFRLAAVLAREGGVVSEPTVFTAEDVNKLYVQKYGEPQADGQMVAGHEFDDADPLMMAPPFIRTN